MSIPTGFELSLYNVTDDFTYWYFHYPDQNITGYEILNRAVSWISVYIDDQEDTLKVLFLKTNVPYRGNHYGMNLLKVVGSIYQNAVKWIQLDDCSDGIPPRNIYFKLGFKVQNRYGRWVQWFVNQNLHGPERKIPIENLVAPHSSSIYH